jgi:hypothetical protein
MPGTLSTERLKQALLFAGLCLVAFGVLWFRRPDAFLYPQFYAEDGRDFFAQAYADGWHSLFYETMGYCVVYARLADIIGLAVGVPLVYMPWAHTLACLAIYVVVWAVVFWRFPAALIGRAIAVLATVLMPIGNEIWMSTTAVQWPMTLLLLMLCTGQLPQCWISRISAAVLLLLASFTGPSVLLIFPVLVLYHWFCGVRSLRAVPWTLWLVAFGAACNALLLLDHGSVERISLMPDTAGPAFVHLPFAQLWFPILGRQVEVIRTLHAILLTALGIAGWWYLVSRTQGIRRPFILACGAGVVVLTAATFITHNGTPIGLSPFTAGTRYFYLPAVLIAWSFIAMVHRFDAIRLTVAAAVLCWWGWLTYSAVGQLVFPDMAWPAYARVLEEQRQPMIIPITPPGWIMYVSEEDATGWPVPWRPEP